MRLVSLLPSGHVEDALCYLGCQADVLSLDPRSLDDVLDSILAIGDRAGVPDRAARLVADLRSRLARTAARVAGRRPPRVAAPSVPTDWPAIAATAPEVLVVAPCGFHLPDAISQAESVARALPGIPVWAIDGDSLVVRPGPRLVDGVDALPSILHPDAVPAVPPGSVHRVSPPG
jgi:iron complex transport system substrate-binding protein